MTSIQWQTASIRQWQKAIHENAREKGFYDREPSDPRTFSWWTNSIARRLLLIHQEVSEAVDELRKPRNEFCDDPLRQVREESKNVMSPETKPEGFPVELADIVIRTLDLAEAMGIDLEEVIARKHEYNKTRPPLHGKRF